MQKKTHQEIQQVQLKENIPDHTSSR